MTRPTQLFKPAGPLSGLAALSGLGTLLEVCLAQPGAQECLAFMEVTLPAKAASQGAVPRPALL